MFITSYFFGKFCRYGHCVIYFLSRRRYLDDGILRHDLVKFLFISLVCFALHACHSIDSVNWPAELPNRQYFIAAYDADSVNQELQTVEAYLQWVVSFYEGTLVAPTGWSAMQTLVVKAALPSKRNALNEQLFLLGRQIAAEWAKENSGRAIDSRMLGIWGAVIQLSASPNEQNAAIQLIASDVNALLLGKLEYSEIRDARYEERLGIQLFGGL